MHLRILGLLVLLILVPTMLSAAEPPGIPDGWSNGYVYANGARLHYYHAKPAPEKPVIVMVHGVTDIGLNWTTLTWELEDDYDIYMLDTRSHGLSDPITTADDGDTLIKDVVEFVEVMDFEEKPILMGHSMGGATVIRIGAEYPDLAQAIVVLDAGISAGGGRGRGGRGARADGGRRGGRGEARRGGGRRGGEARRGGGRRGGVARRGGRRGAPQGDDSEPERLSVSMSGPPEQLVAQNNYDIEDLVAASQERHPKWGMADHQYWALSKKQYHGSYSSEAFREVMQGSMRTGDSLANIPVPVLILKADAPPETREAHQEAASVIPNGKLVHIDDAGHNLHHDELERTAEVLKEFLSTL